MPRSRRWGADGKREGEGAKRSTLADRYVAGAEVSLTEVEDAISAYAAEHPNSIRIASLSGYGEVFLTGAWPATITLKANGGDGTVIIIVGENSKV